MYKYHNKLLPLVFISSFIKITQIHSYNTRLAAKQSYYLPKARTNYGKLDFKVHQHGTPLINILNHLLCLYLKRT